MKTENDNLNQGFDLSKGRFEIFDNEEHVNFTDVSDIKTANAVKKEYAHVKKHLKMFVDQDEIDKSFNEPDFGALVVRTLQENE